MDHATNQNSGNALCNAQRDQLVELCRYYAQALYAVRNGMDSLGQEYPKVILPPDGNVPAQAVLLDGVVGPYENAASVLVDCGFATERFRCSGVYTLEMASDDFTMDIDTFLARRATSFNDDAFKHIFSFHDVNGYLGHPDTLQRIFDLFCRTGLTEIRYGQRVWSDRAIDLAASRFTVSVPCRKVELLWGVDTFDLYLAEAKAQWSRRD